MESVFIFLYPLVGFVHIAGYFPQIRSLMLFQTRAEGMSLSSWLTWCLGSSVSWGYGIFHLKDPMFCIVTGLGLLMCLLTTFLIVYNRHMRPAYSAKPADSVSLS